MSVWRRLPLALSVSIAGAVHAQGPVNETRCYEFDQPYFSQVRVDNGSLPGPDTTNFGRELAKARAARATQHDAPDPNVDYLLDSVRLERTAVVRLEPVAADSLTINTLGPASEDGPRRPGDGHRRLVAMFTLPEVTRRTAQGRPLVRRFSPHWQPLPADSLGISWHTGYAGPVFRLAIRGDSLIGTVVHLSDVIRTDSVTGRVIQPPQLPARAVRIACGAPSRGPA